MAGGGFGANTARVARAVDQACLARAQNGVNMALDKHRIAQHRLPTHGGAIPANGGALRHWPEDWLGGECSSCGQGCEPGVPSQSTD